MSNNVMGAIPSGKCYGCGICAGICPESALRMRINKYGFYRPTEMQNKCTDCGLCLNVCPANSKPAINSRKADGVFGKYIDILGGWTRNDRLRKESSAGGIARQLAYELLSKGRIDGLLTVTPNESNLLNPQLRLYTKEEDLKSIAKSLYIPTEYSEAVRYLSRNSGRYLVTGLPCHIAGLRRAQEYLKAEVILIDLFCGRMVSRLLTEGYIKLFTKEKLGSLSIDYRDKGTGWYDFSISVKNRLNNAVIVRQHFGESIFGFLMNRRYFAQDSCLKCSYGYSGVGDITLGDFWKSDYRNERQGVSLIVTRTEYGKEVLETSEALVIFQAGTVDLYSAQSHLVRNCRHSQSKLFTFLRQKQRVINKIAIILYLLSKNLKLVYLLCKIDYSVYGIVAKSLCLIRRSRRGGK